MSSGLRKRVELDVEAEVAELDRLALDDRVDLLAVEQLGLLLGPAGGDAHREDGCRERGRERGAEREQRYEGPVSAPARVHEGRESRHGPHGRPWGAGPLRPPEQARPGAPRTRSRRAGAAARASSGASTSGRREGRAGGRGCRGLGPEGERQLRQRALAAAQLPDRAHAHAVPAAAPPPLDDRGGPVGDVDHGLDVVDARRADPKARGGPAPRRLEPLQVQVAHEVAGPRRRRERSQMRSKTASRGASMAMSREIGPIARSFCSGGAILSPARRIPEFAYRWNKAGTSLEVRSP